MVKRKIKNKKTNSKTIKTKKNNVTKKALLNKKKRIERRGRKPKIATNQESVKEKFIPQTLRGMHDVLPEEQISWDFVLEKMIKNCRAYGFNQIITPILEDVNLFKRSIGLSTDIVQKEMFSFIDKGGREIALRPEITAGVVRAYIERGMSNLSQPLKLYSFGPVFRHEKPQAGRYREFHQFNLEVLGSNNSVVEAQLIALAHNIFKESKIKNELQVNSLGCAECRKEYQRKLIDDLKNKRKSFCFTCQERLTKNPLRIFDCKEKQCQELSKHLPSLIDSLCEGCKGHLIKVLENLDELQIPYNLNPRLVRGLDYYTKTVFEFWPERQDSSDGEKAKIALAAGGRYDNLVRELGGKETPACGLAFGLERFNEEIKFQKISLPINKKTAVFLAHIGEAAKKRALSVFEVLKERKIDVKEALAKDSLKAQLELANKLGVKFVLIIGQDEVSNKTVIIKDMKSGIQEIVDLKKLPDEVKKRL